MPRPQTPSLRDGIVLSNVERNHAYPIAEAAAQAGYLKKFVTSIYYKPSTLFGRMSYSLASRAQGAAGRKRLESRRSDAIPDDKVVDIPLPEMFEVALRASGRDARSVHYLRSELFDWIVAQKHVAPCAIFHGFEQSSLFSLRRARQIGAITVLDQPIIHRTTLDRIERDERVRHGIIGPSSTPFWFEEHVKRKSAELELADFVFCGLDYVKTTMIENGFPADRVYVVPYGADTATYRPVERPLRSGLEILYAGPLNFWKGLPYLLDVMSGLDVKGARLTIVGRIDPDWTPRLMPRIKALGERVRYLGVVASKDMAKVYADADVFAFPSLVGGLGLVCFEAMATALPVVTSHGDVILRDGQDGLAIPPQDIGGWRQAFAKLAADREYRLRLGAAGAERLKLFTWDAYRRGTVRAYEEIAHRQVAGELGPTLGARGGGASCPLPTA